MEQQLDLVLAALMPANRLVCMVMLYTGLRVDDVLSLPLSKVKRNFTIVEAKTQKRRRVGLTDDLIAQIKAQAGGSFWAFPSPRDPEKHRTRQAVWKDLKRAQRAFRLDVNVGSHSMRKVYAVELMAKYGELEKVRLALNHDDITTTALYAFADRLTETARARKRKKP